MDNLVPTDRSKAMSSVRGKNTRPELLVRRLLHKLGFRFRLHRRDLPGSPDIVLPKHRSCIFVHGCFWHQHPGCKRSSIPATNTEFWLGKLNSNVERDKRVALSLQALGWRTLVVWECETKNPTRLSDVLLQFLLGPLRSLPQTRTTSKSQPCARSKTHCSNSPAAR